MTDPVAGGPEHPPGGASRREGRRITWGLALVAVGLPLVFFGTFPLLAGLLATDTPGWDLALIGLAALVPGVLLVVIGIGVMARAPRAADDTPRSDG